MIDNNPVARQDAFYDLLRAALPRDVTISDLEPLAPLALWDANPAAALALALKKSPRVNWRAYAYRYRDVKDSGIDPFSHFINHGVFEGRKLVSWHQLKKACLPDAPLVSVCVINFNNSVYLDKCLASVASQSLDNIEIIVVDDASTDSSTDIIRKWAEKDSRIKPVFGKTNRGSFKARKEGAERATGEYLLFLDSDDYLDPRACEVAWERIAEGYDIVEFCFLVNNAARVDNSRIIKCQAYADCVAPTEYKGLEIINGIFHQRSLRWNICGKIIMRELFLEALADMGDGFDINVEDLYAMVAIARRSRSLLKIPEKLYIYNFGIGYSTGAPAPDLLDRWFSLGSTVARTGEYAALNGVNIDFERVKQDMGAVSLERWIYAVPPESAAKYWKILQEQYGFEFLIDTLAARFKNQIIPFANQYSNCLKFERKREFPSRRIGLYYQRLTKGGVQVVIGSMARALIERGYEVVIFSEEAHADQIDLPEKAEVIYLNCDPDDAGRMARILGARATESGIDLMIYASMGNPNLIWGLLALHKIGVQVIINYHGDFSLAYARRPIAFNHYEQNAVFRCAHAVTCLSRATESWLRLAGVNAWRLPNQIRSARIAANPGSRNIAVLGRMGDPVKQVGQSLLVLREVAKKIPDAKMFLIGDFMLEEHKSEFWSVVRNMGLQNNVVLTGWTDEPERYLAQCGVLLSTSWWESFALGIGEAQAMGLPCVIYDVAIEQAGGNGSIIAVRQGDYRAAARAIIRLFEDSALRGDLGNLARRMASRYSGDRFGAALRDLLNGYNQASPWMPPQADLYQYIIKYASFYGGRSWPGDPLERGLEAGARN